MKKFITSLAVGVVAFSGVFNVVSADEGVIDEMWGSPTFMYGGSLSDEQKLETKNILNISEGFPLEEIPVTGEDLVKYNEKGNPNANMYSSAYIEKVDEGSGVIVEVVTPENITGVSTSQYANALITAGAEDVHVKVVSPVKVTGHSALTGVYKAYDMQGAELDKDRMLVAQEELDVTTSIAKDNQGVDGFNSESLSQALIDIKTELAGIKEKLGNDVTEDDINKVVNDAIKKNELGGIVTEEQISKLVDFAKRYMETGAISSESVKEQLGSLTSQVAENLKNKTDEFGNKVKDVVTSEGFWEGVKDFFTGLFDSIKGFFASSDGVEDELQEETEGDAGYIEVEMEPVGGNK